MSPTLKKGDNVVVFAFTAAPMPGDIVMYLHPKDISALYVHRLIGLPGDRIQMLDGHLHLNGQPVKRERVEDFETVEGEEEEEQEQEARACALVLLCLILAFRTLIS
jgi:signal peptidase I